MTEKITYKLQDDNNAIGAYLDNAQVGKITFVHSGENTLIIDYTGVDATLQGRGVGTELVRQVVKLARGQNKKIIPVCPFARAVFVKYPELND